MISKEDWFMIEAQIEKGVYQKDIAETLGVHPKTGLLALAVKQEVDEPAKEDPESVP